MFVVEDIWIILRQVAFMTNTDLSDLSIVGTCDILVYPKRQSHAIDLIG